MSIKALRRIWIGSYIVLFGSLIMVVVFNNALPNNDASIAATLVVFALGLIALGASYFSINAPEASPQWVRKASGTPTPARMKISGSGLVSLGVVLLALGLALLTGWADFD